MNRNRLIIILLSVLALLLLVYFLYNNPNEKRFQWSENYKANSDQPYGTLFIKELLKDYRPGNPFIFNEDKPLSVLLDSNVVKGKTDYVFIGQTLYLGEDDADALLNFISSGNDAFVSTLYLPFDIIDPIFTEACSQSIYLEKNEVKSVTLNFYHDSLKTKAGYTYAYRYGLKDQSYFWNTVNRNIFCESMEAIIPLGYQDPDRVNFFKFPYGSGNLYIHTNPIAFTNYFLSHTDKTAYAEGVFSHLQGKSMIWDEVSKAKFTENNAPYSSPLSYILQQRSLKYAWWLMLACALLYILFTAKRKQRVIPVLQSKANTSLEFVNMISALHYQNGDHLDIARKKMKYFLHFLRARYGMSTHDFTEAYFIRLSEKSKVEIKIIELIFDEYNQMERHVHYNADKLVSLYNAIENFYKHCK